MPWTERFHSGKVVNGGRMSQTAPIPANSGIHRYPPAAFPMALMVGAAIVGTVLDLAMSLSLASGFLKVVRSVAELVTEGLQIPTPKTVAVVG